MAHQPTTGTNHSQTDTQGASVGAGTYAMDVTVLVSHFETSELKLAAPLNIWLQLCAKTRTGNVC